MVYIVNKLIPLFIIMIQGETYPKYKPVYTTDR